MILAYLDNDQSKGGDAHHLPDLLHQLLHGDDLGVLLRRAVEHRVLPNQQVANTYKEAAPSKRHPQSMLLPCRDDLRG